jgi:hypothetical protein
MKKSWTHFDNSKESSDHMRIKYDWKIWIFYVGFYIFESQKNEHFQGKSSCVLYAPKQHNYIVITNIICFFSLNECMSCFNIQNHKSSSNKENLKLRSYC